MTDAPPRIFISYALKDGADFAKKLREMFLRENLSVFQDIFTLEGGRDWWSQIEAALKSRPLQHLVLVVTPAALASTIVRKEIRLARQEGKTVSPIRGPGLPSFHELPRWLGQLYDPAMPEHRDTLLRVLRAQSQQARMPMMAPEPPADFVPRPREFDALKTKLLDAKGDAIAITAALRGAGGYGKTTLAKALAHDADIQDGFYDGVLWVELGEKPENLMPVLSDLSEVLSGERPGVETINAAAAKLGEALGDRRILLVIDDVWREQDLRPFLRGGRNTTRLITTRIDTVLPLGTERQPVDAMHPDEALNLLAAGLPENCTSTVWAELGELTHRLGKWAQLLKLVNGFLRDRVLKGHQPLAEAIVGVNRRLDAKGLIAFDARNETERTKAVARTIGVSLELLDENSRARFAELSVFPQDVDIPMGIAARLWHGTDGLDELDTEDLLIEFGNLSLLLSLDLEQKTLRLHDTVRHFLQEQAGRNGLAAQHQRLLNALDHSQDLGDKALCYYYRHYLHHLAGADNRDGLESVLLSPGWLNSKLSVLGSPQSLVSDYDLYARTPFQKLIGQTLRLTMGICVRDKRQLIPQLLGRLMTIASPECSHFLSRARSRLGKQALVPFHASLTPPGAETARLEGHADWVNALCQLADGRLASASGDATIRLWDVRTAAETTRLEGHIGWVNALYQLADGRLASASNDSTIRLWDAQSGAETARLEGHPDWVNALYQLADGRLASASNDGIIRLWDAQSGAETAQLNGHAGRINALCQLADGRLASASDDASVRLWDAQSGTETARLEGHAGWIRALCPLADGRIASASNDTTIRLWDAQSGTETARLEGHASGVRALCQLPDGRIASASNDTTIRLWDAQSGTETARLEGYAGGLRALCPLADGRLASASDDATIRLWDVRSGAGTARLEGHAGRVIALCPLADGRIASASSDRSIRLWGVRSGTETARLEGHLGAVTALCQLANGRLASSSSDRSIHLWDAWSGTKTKRYRDIGWVTALCPLADGGIAWVSKDATIRLWYATKDFDTVLSGGHVGLVNALCQLADGRLASASDDTTIRLWNAGSGAKTARLMGHAGGVRALCQLADGRLASASDDTTVRLWDTQSGAEIARLEGHAGRVNALCQLADGCLASASNDSTIRLWDAQSGAETARLEVDAAVLCLAAISPSQLAAGDALGHIHWLEIIG